MSNPSISIFSTWISDLGKRLKTELKTSKEGSCTFQIGEEMLISASVSPDFPQVHLYSTLLSFPEDDYEKSLLIMTRALELNCFQALTRGGAIAAPPGGGSLLFCYNMPIEGNDSQSFARIVDAFYDTVIQLRKALAEIESAEEANAPLDEEKEETQEQAANKTTKPMNWMKI